MSTRDPAWLSTAAWQAVLNSQNKAPVFKRILQEAADRRDDSDGGQAEGEALH